VGGRQACQCALFSFDTLMRQDALAWEVCYAAFPML
jgi:hypothetical protein